MRQLLRVLPVAVFVALAVPVMNPYSAAASPVDQQRQRVEDIVNELERLEEQANRLAEDYVGALDTKSQLEQDIAAAEVRVAEKEAELAKIRGSLGEMALRSFMGSGSTPLGPLFEPASDINAVLQRDQLARVALSAGEVTTDQLDALVDDLQAERKDLESKRDQVTAIAESLQSQQSETDQRTQEYIQARAEAEATLGELLAEEEARRARESAERVARELAASQAANDNNGGNTGNNGGTTGGGGGSSTTGGGGGGGSTTGGGGGSGGGSTPTAPNNPAPPVSSRASIAVQSAMSQLGVPYRYATSNPGVSFDCSGLTKYAWAQAGVYLPHQSRAQYASLPHVAKGAAQPGDLLFFYSPISHVSVYLGGGQHVHAPNTGSYVKTGAVNWGNVVGVGRPG